MNGREKTSILKATKVHQTALITANGTTDTQGTAGIFDAIDASRNFINSIIYFNYFSIKQVLRENKSFLDTFWEDVADVPPKKQHLSLKMYN